MTLSKSKSPATHVVCIAMFVLGVWLPAAAADDAKPVPQYVYKTVGQRELTADVLYPDGWSASDTRPAMVFFSGGAWRSGGTTQFLQQAQYFAKRGLVTVRAEYRDSTKDKATPDVCLKDAVSAMRWVRKHAKVLGIDPDRIVSSGGSAGGYLAVAVATIDDFHSEGDDLSVSPKPNAMVLFNPVVDFVTLDRAAEFGIAGDLAVRISPLGHVTKDLPPTLILIGSEDNFLGQNQQFMSKAKQFGVRVELDLAEGQPHAYFNRSPWMEKTVASADRFLVSLGYLGEEPRVELPSSAPQRSRASLRLELRSRVETDAGSGRFKEEIRTARWNPRATAIIVCDMWNSHTCSGAAGRVAEMAPAVDLAVKAARQQGVLIIHAPSGTTSFYEDTPQRRRALEAAFAKAPVEIKWNRWDPDREGEPLTEIVDGGCACPEPCPNFEVDENGFRHWKKGGQIPWTRQIDSITIARQDAVSDNGQEIYNLIQQRNIDNVILLGVHTNICVSGRPFGLRQMTYFGKNVALCRDLTDALFQPTSGHLDQFRGTDLVVEHIEKHICPTITSTSLTGKPAFRFRDDEETALKQIGLDRGICVVLGLPKGARPEFLTDLAGGSELVIYFQSPDPNEVAEVRKAAEAAGVLGDRVFVDFGDSNVIHLADNLAGAVLVGPVAESAVDEKELLRVLHPQGKAIVRGRQIVKPSPEGIDDWPYPYHGADNNPQSTDRLARAPYLTQYLAEPKFAPSPAVTVAAGGRIFRACGHLAHKSPQNPMVNTLLAVNAYNGTILWKRPLSKGLMVLRNTIIATPDVLYLADDASCKLLNAATGQLEGEIVSPRPEIDGKVWKWMALEGGVLCGLIGGEEFEAPVLTSEEFGLGGWPRANWPGFDYADRETAWTQGRTLVAVDTKTRKLLWRHREPDPIDGRAVCMSAGRIYFLSPEKFLGCRDAKTGKVLWRTSDADLLAAIGPLFPKTPRWTGLSPFPYVKCNDRFVFFSGPRIPRIVAVSAGDGTLVWQKEVPINDGGSVHLLLRDDALYAIGDGPVESSFSMEYATGEVLREFLGRRACTVATGSVDSIFYRATGGTVRLDLDTGSEEHIAPMRPPCYEGVIISDGLLHWGAWKCRCQLSLYGHVCLGPAGAFDFRPGVNGSQLTTGAGDPGTVEKLDVHPEDWPCEGGDNQRTSRTAAGVSGQVSRAWTYEPRLAAMPTAPVVAAGMVFVADRSGLVRALNVADGSLKWKAYTGAGIFFPPALWEGRVYVGSADGHVYAFEAATGRLLWRFRAAPAARWIPVYGKLMSTWPVAGGVVVADGVVYAAAGISHYDGIHVYALDALTGETRWHNGTSGKLNREVNSGVSLQGNLYLDGNDLCFSGGNACSVARYDLATGKCTSPPGDRAASAFRTAFYAYYPQHGQYMALSHTLPDGRFLDYTVNHSGALHTTLALFEPLEPAVRPKPGWRILRPQNAPKTVPAAVWEHKPGARYNSFVLAPEVLLATGQVPLGDRTRAFLAAVKIDDGSQIWRKELPAPAVKSGTAVDHTGRIIVSLQDGRVLSFLPEE